MRPLSGSFAEPEWPRFDVSWRRLLALDADLATLLALTIGATLCSAVFTLWAVLTPLAGFRVDAASLVVMAFLLAPLHEHAHALAFPRPADSPRASVRFSLRRFTLCAHYDGAVSRRRFLAVLAAPLAVLSVAPILVSSALGTSPGDLVLLTLLNALASAGDVLTFVLVAFQVPPGATLRAQGDGLAWKDAAIA